MKGRILCGAVAVLAIFALTAGSASARTFHTARFSAFGFKVTCGQNVKQLGGITCYSPALPSSELDGYALIRRHGVTKLGERGDSPFINGKNTKLQVGDRWRRAGVGCVLKPKKVRCHNADGHGISLSPTDYVPF